MLLDEPSPVPLAKTSARVVISTPFVTLVALRASLAQLVRKFISLVHYLFFRVVHINHVIKSFLNTRRTHLSIVVLRTAAL